MQRITQKFLEKRVKMINELKNIETGYNIKDCYHLDSAYGGVALYQYTGNSGSVRDISRMGHVPKRELSTFIDGFLAAMC